MLTMIVTTFADEVSAKVFAEKLLSERLAVCIQLTPITSLYRWQGVCEESAECRMVIKAKRADLSAISDFFKAHHPYDVPQFIEVAVESVSDDYLDWALNS